MHTSGHASLKDIMRVIDGLDPDKIIPIHTMNNKAFLDYSNKVSLQNDGEIFEC